MANTTTTTAAQATTATTTAQAAPAQAAQAAPAQAAPAPAKAPAKAPGKRKATLAKAKAHAAATAKAAPARHKPAGKGAQAATQGRQPQPTTGYNGGKPFKGKAPAALAQAIAAKQAAVNSPRAALRYVARHVGTQATQAQFIAAAQAANALHAKAGRTAPACNTAAGALRQWQKGRGLPIT
jgi:hypothetical protein